MNLRYSALCLIALFIVVVLALKNYETWTSPFDAPPEKALSKKAAAKSDGQPQTEQKGPNSASSIASYIFIAEKNPFSPDRKEYPIIAAPPVPTPPPGLPSGPAAAPPAPEVKKPPIVRPQVTLYGVTIGGDSRWASISYPGRPLQKGEREAVTLKIGEQIGEYKLVKILEDRIALEGQEDSFEVFLYDSKNPKRRVVARTESRPAAVTSTLPGAPEPIRPGAAPVPGVAPVPGPAPVPGAPVPGMPIRAGGASGTPTTVPATPSVNPSVTPSESPAAAAPTPSSPRTRRWFGPRTQQTE